MIINATYPAKIFYGLHSSPGTAEYADKEGKPYKILLNSEALLKMNPTFMGKPVYVDHVDKVDLSKVEREAAGWVIESFYNKSDGMTWCKFVCISDAGQDAIRRGWKLSNAYIPKNLGAGGTWHGMTYEKEIVDAEYEHLAIVPNPRYEASVILDPDQFKAYNQEKEATLLKIANSKDVIKKGDKSMFKIFKKDVVQNSDDMNELMVTLPKSGKEVTIKNAIEMADKFVNINGYAADEHMVKVNDKEEMSVKDLKDCYGKMKSEADEMKKKNDDADMENKKKNETMSEEDKKKNAEEEEKKKNEEEDKKKNEDKEKEEKKENSMHFDTLRNAAQKADLEKAKTLVMNSDRVALGKKLF